MNDYISREAAISMFAELQELANKRVCDTPADSPCYMRYVTQVRERDDTVRRLRKLTAADVRPVVRGKWLPTKDDNKKRCSHCDVIHLIAQYPYGNANFCPNCGADMRGE